MTLKLEKGLPSLRRRRELRALMVAFRAGCERPGFRLVHYAVLSSHLHLVVEGKDRASLTRWMRGLLVRMARALNRLWRRSGRVFADRFHDRILKTPREVKHALAYLFHNARKHGYSRPARPQPDPYSSGRRFDGWRNHSPAATEPGAGRHLAHAHTWLLRVGWRRHGLLEL